MMNGRIHSLSFQPVDIAAHLFCPFQQGFANRQHRQLAFDAVQLGSYAMLQLLELARRISFPARTIPDIDGVTEQHSMAKLSELLTHGLLTIDANGGLHWPRNEAC
jgi:hypothetical protein